MDRFNSFRSSLKKSLFNLTTFKGIAIAIQAIDCPKKINADKYHTFAQTWLDEFHSSTVKWSWLRSGICGNYFLFLNLSPDKTETD